MNDSLLAKCYIKVTAFLGWSWLLLLSLKSAESCDIDIHP